MPSQYPLTPFRISDETPVCDRVAILRNLAVEGMQYASVHALAKIIYQQALARAQLFRDMAANDPAMQAAMKSPSWFQRLLALEALRAVQSLPYVHDPKDEEWFQSSDYTARHGGDCKDSTVLLTSLDRLLGLQAEAVWITQTGQMINHVTGRVWLDGQWYWQDGSIRGAMLGESAYEAEPRLGAQDVTGRVNPAGQQPDGQQPDGQLEGALPKVDGYPFAWSGWKTLWAGWPTNWWCNNYQYLCIAYGSVVKDPVAFGFYPISKPNDPFGGIQFGATTTEPILPTQT